MSITGAPAGASNTLVSLSFSVPVNSVWIVTGNVFNTNGVGTNMNIFLWIQQFTASSVYTTPTLNAGINSNTHPSIFGNGANIICSQWQSASQSIVSFSGICQVNASTSHLLLVATVGGSVTVNFNYAYIKATRIA